MGCSPSTPKSPEARAAKFKSKENDRILKEYHEEDMRTRKLLLLGIGESGKSTIVKQMKIIHIEGGFNTEERMKKVPSIKQNIQESIVTILSAMNTLEIELKKEESKASAKYIMENATGRDYQCTQEFFDHVETLWDDEGVRHCYQRSNEYQLIDCAAYFLDRVNAVRNDDYEPTDQDILRCRVTTVSINKIDFSIKDGKKKKVHFSAFDVGGQRGERRRWIQVFECVTAILFIVDSSSFDQTLREDETKNRLLESLEIFEQTWRNRFLKTVSVILFINKIDRLREKVDCGRSVQCMIDSVPQDHKLYNHIQQLDFTSFQPREAERKKFLRSYPGYQAQKKLSKSHSISDDVRRSCDLDAIDSTVVKNAVFIMKMFMGIAQGKSNDAEASHTCHYFYTCAINTDNVQKVLEGSKSIVIEEHFRRFGIL